MCCNNTLYAYGRPQKHGREEEKDGGAVVILYVPGEPHGGEVTPAQFADHMVFPIVEITNFHMVVATYKYRAFRLQG